MDTEHTTFWRPSGVSIYPDRYATLGAIEPSDRGGGQGGRRAGDVVPFHPLAPCEHRLRLLSAHVCSDLDWGVSHVLVDPARDRSRFREVSSREGLVGK